MSMRPEKRRDRGPRSSWFDWTRYWSPWGNPPATDDYGFLLDPEQPYGNLLNPVVARIEDLAEVPILVLLGEPGMGKSSEFARAEMAAQAETADHRNVVLSIDLRNVEGVSDLRELLNESEQIAAWRAGANLTLFFDSLDEGMLTTPVLADRLAYELGKLSPERLRVRLACRTAVWPASAEDELRRAFGDASVKVYVLAPLRRADVELAALADDLPDAPHVMQRILEVGAGTLATRPITLRFIFQAIRLGNIPRTMSSLFEQGSLHLVGEQSVGRRSRGNAGTLDSFQRLAIASRLAALTVFSNRPFLYDGPPAFSHGSDLSTDDVAGGVELVARPSQAASQLEVTTASIREILDTGLFAAGLPGTGADDNHPDVDDSVTNDWTSGRRFEWVHRTIAEYLAARWLRLRGLSVAQLSHLFVTQGDGPIRLVPQLHETAGWLAGMDRDFLRFVLRIEPEVLLTSDIATTDDDDRAALVASLLDLAEHGELGYAAYDAATDFGGLQYPGLQATVLAAIEDNVKPVDVRVLALRIATACNTPGLGPLAAGLALDSGQAMRLRSAAARYVRNVGDAADKARLSPLVAKPPHASAANQSSSVIAKDADSDPADDLRGIAWAALWPGVLTTRELFAALTPPKRDSYIGSYKLFLHELPDRLAGTDIPAALDWVLEQSREHSTDEPLMTLGGELAEKLLWPAWRIWNDPDVISKFVPLIARRLLALRSIVDRDHAKQVSDLILTSVSIRQQIIAEMVGAISQDSEANPGMIITTARVAQSRDIHWVIDNLRRAESRNENAQVVSTWAGVASVLAASGDDEAFGAAFDAAFKNKVTPALAQEMAKVVGPVDLDSPQAKQAREHFALLDNLRNRSHIVAPAKSYREKVAELLDSFDAGNLDSFWTLNYELARSADGQFVDELDPELAGRPMWADLDENVRNRVVEAAKTYLNTVSPRPDLWPDGRPDGRPDLAGFRALRLLQREAPSVYASLSDDTWQRWAAIVIAYPSYVTIEDDEWLHELVQRAYRKAPSEVAAAVRRIIVSGKSPPVFALSRIEPIWNVGGEALAKVLLEVCQDGGLPAESLRMTLETLLTYDIDEARRLIENLLARRAADPAARDKALAAAAALFSNTTDAGWTTIWPMISGDAPFGKALMLLLAAASERPVRDLELKLPEADLAKLYLYLVAIFPFDEDPDEDDVHTVTPRESVGYWRNGILSQLEAMATAEAVLAVRSIRDALPQHEWLRRTVAAAEANARRAQWEPVEPETLLSLSSDRQAIVTGRDLADAVVSSIQRFESHDLRGENASVLGLWNEDPNHRWRPKNEEALSGAIARHLTRDLKRATTAREVRIRPRVGGAAAEDVDILVEAEVSRIGGESGRVSVAIEVKGQWNPSATTAMREQLVERYLFNHPEISAGVYVVGWYLCEEWDRTDTRYASARRKGESLLEFNQRVVAQAAALSRPGTDVRGMVIDVSLGRSQPR